MQENQIDAVALPQGEDRPMLLVLRTRLSAGHLRPRPEGPRIAMPDETGSQPRV